MAHVVMQAAEFSSIEGACAAERELDLLVERYIAFEKTDPNPWDTQRVAPPLLEFGARHGIDWPLREDTAFLLKGSFAEVAELIRIDRMVFLWGGGFELGGETFRSVLAKLGAVNTSNSVHLIIPTRRPSERAAELAEFLNDEDYEGQFLVTTTRESALFSLRFENNDEHCVLAFDSSGVQDWAFVAALPQLDGEDPSFAPESTGRMPS